jgi:hypothetical protein
MTSGRPLRRFLKAYTPNYALLRYAFCNSCGYRATPRYHYQMCGPARLSDRGPEWVKGGCHPEADGTTGLPSAPEMRCVLGGCAQRPKLTPRLSLPRRKPLEYPVLKPSAFSLLKA